MKRVLFKIIFGVGVYIVIGVAVTAGYFSHPASRGLDYGALVVLPAGPFIWPILGGSMIVYEIENVQKKQRAQKELEERTAQNAMDFQKAVAVCPKELEAACYYYNTLVYQQQGKDRFSREQAQNNLLAYVRGGNLPWERGELSPYLDMGKRICSIHGLRLLLGDHVAGSRQGAAPTESSQQQTTRTASFFAARLMLDDLQSRLDKLVKFQDPHYSYYQDDITPEFLRLAANDVAGITAAYERWFAEAPEPRLYIRLAFLWNTYAEGVFGVRDMKSQYEYARKKALGYSEAALKSPDIPDVEEGLYAVLRYTDSWTAAKPVFEAVLQTLGQGRVLGQGKGNGSGWFDRLALEDFWLSQDAGKIPKAFEDDPIDILFAFYWPHAQSEDEKREMARLVLPVIANNPDRHYSLAHPLEQWRRLCFDMYLKSKDETWLELWDLFYTTYLPDLQADFLYFRAERAFIAGEEERAKALLHRHMVEAGGKTYALSKEYGVSNETLYYKMADPGYTRLTPWPTTDQSWAFRHLMDKYRQERRQHERKCPR